MTERESFEQFRREIKEIRDLLRDSLMEWHDPSVDLLVAAVGRLVDLVEGLG